MTALSAETVRRLDDALSRRGFLGAAASLISAKLAGCGVLLHPERVGQPRGEMDWEIVALDALGLILFFIPGVVAFVVDFSTGAIYLPPCGGYSGTEPVPADQQWRMVAVPPDELTQTGIAATVTRETGKPVDLTAPEVQSRPIDSLDAAEQEMATQAAWWEE
jgi:hypothetical protein